MVSTDTTYLENFAYNENLKLILMGDDEMIDSKDTLMIENFNSSL